MTFTMLDFVVDGGIATITLNRPERRNAYDPAMAEAVVAAAQELREHVGAEVAGGTGQQDHRASAVSRRRARTCPRSGASRRNGGVDGGSVGTRSRRIRGKVQVHRPGYSTSTQ